MRQQIRNPKSEIRNPNDFRQIFLADSINKLTALEPRVRTQFDEALRREAFRTIHTIKGGAQTFDLPQTAQIADELENSLSGSATAESKELILEGIKVLLNFLRTNEPDASEKFLEKLRLFGRKASPSEILYVDIPVDLFKSLSILERNAIVSALREGKNIFCVEVGFDAANFADAYRNLRHMLEDQNKIIASLPSEKHKTAKKIGFRMITASHETAESLRTLLESINAEITAHNPSQNDARGLSEMLRQIAAHGTDIAEKSGKEVRFTIFSNGAELADDLINDFFEILLHLVRNAVDHAIEKTGTVEILFFEETGEFRLSVADDGSGIDLQKVRARAAAKNLISDDDRLDAQEILELIFAPEFSTAETITEISGRGVGLDAVKNAVTKMNGKISVRNRNIKGAIFEISVPK